MQEVATIFFDFEVVQYTTRGGGGGGLRADTQTKGIVPKSLSFYRSKCKPLSSNIKLLNKKQVTIKFRRFQLHVPL